MSSYEKRASSWARALEDVEPTVTDPGYQEALAPVRDVEELDVGVEDFDVEKEMEEALDYVF